MARQEQVQVNLNPEEYRIFVDILNDERNERIDEAQSTDDIDNLLRKAADAPVRKVRVRGGERLP